MILLSWLIGKAGGAWLYERSEKSDFTAKDCILTGWMVLIGLAEVAHLMGVLTGRSFSACVNIFLMEELAAFLVALIALILFYGVLKKGKLFHPREIEQRREKKTYVLFGVFALLLLGQIGILLFSNHIYTTGDMTVETVQTFLTTDRLYQDNPLTGQPYTLGMPLRIKILCLPTLYGSICKLLPLDVTFVIRKLIPLFVLLAFYMAYASLADVLWQERKDLKAVFLVVIAVLVFASNGMYSLDGFDLLYSGFRGVTIRACVLVPYTISTMLRKKWILTLLCIFSEACIVWTLYGLGSCVFIVAVMLLLRLIRRWAK